MEEERNSSSLSPLWLTWTSWAGLSCFYLCSKSHHRSIATELDMTVQRVTFTTCPGLIWHPRHGGLDKWTPWLAVQTRGEPGLSQHQASLGCSDLLAQHSWARQGTGSICPQVAEIQTSSSEPGEASLPLQATLRWLKDTLCQSWVPLQRMLCPSPSQFRLYQGERKLIVLETNPDGQKISAVESPSPQESPGNGRNIAQHGTENFWEVILKTMSHTLRLEMLL